MTLTYNINYFSFISELWNSDFNKTENPFSLCFDGTDLFPRGPPLAQTHLRFPVICGICMRPDRHTAGLIHQFFPALCAVISTWVPTTRGTTRLRGQNITERRETARDSTRIYQFRISTNIQAIWYKHKHQSSFCTCCLQWGLVSPRFKNSRFKRSVGVFHRRKEQWWLWFNSTNYFKYEHTSEAFFEYSVQMYYTIYYRCHSD